MIVQRTVLFFMILIFLPLAAGSVEKPYRAKHAMVVSADARASDVGVRIMRNGGNAVDAAVAVGFALAVVFPEAGNVGGGGFMVIHMHDGRSATIDFRETAPAKSTASMYLDSAGNPTDASLEGYRSAGIPGTVAGLLKALQMFGSMSRARVIGPAIALAKHGLLVNERLAGLFQNYKDKLLLYASTARFLSSKGRLPQEGETIKLNALAAALQRIAATGCDGFYRGKTAQLIVKEMQQGGGIITAGDLARYAALVRKPLGGSYRGYEILTCPPPSSGGICLLEALNILEGYDLSGFGYHSAKSIHFIAEAMKRAHADRAHWLGDPDFVKMPVDQLISKEYAMQRRKEIDSIRATAQDDVLAGQFPTQEGNNTTNFSVIDAEGNVVAVTYTLNDLFGSKVIVDGGGFFLNDEMDDFSAKPGAPNTFGLIGAQANAIEPNKRPLSSIVPTIVLKDGKPILVLGARGGPRIISAVLQAIIDVVDYDMNIQDAVSMPRFHHQWTPDTLRYEQRAFSKETLDALMNAGYHCAELPFPNAGAMECIAIDPETGIRYGGEDPREGGVAAGY